MLPSSLSLRGAGQEGQSRAREDKGGQGEWTQGNTLATYTAFWISST